MRRSRRRSPARRSTPTWSARCRPGPAARRCRVRSTVPPTAASQRPSTSWILRDAPRPAPASTTTRLTNLPSTIWPPLLYWSFSRRTGIGPDRAPIVVLPADSPRRGALVGYVLCSSLLGKGNVPLEALVLLALLLPGAAESLIRVSNDVVVFAWAVLMVAALSRRDELRTRELALLAALGPLLKLTAFPIVAVAAVVGWRARGRRSGLLIAASGLASSRCERGAPPSVQRNWLQRLGLGRNARGETRRSGRWRSLPEILVGRVLEDSAALSHRRPSGSRAGPSSARRSGCWSDPAPRAARDRRLCSPAESEGQRRRPSLAPPWRRRASSPSLSVSDRSSVSGEASAAGTWAGRHGWRSARATCSRFGWIASASSSPVPPWRSVSFPPRLVRRGLGHG